MDCQIDKFDLPPEVTYLNMAYQSPLLRTSQLAGTAGLKRKSRPYTISAEDFFQPLKEVQRLFAELIDCNDPARIAYQPSVSYGMANVVSNLPIRSGGNIVLLDQQFPSNVYPFDEFARKNDIEIRFVNPPDGYISDRASLWNQRIIEAIDQNTICISLPHCHWADGTLFDLAAIKRQCDQFDTWMIIDGTQSVGAIPFSVEEINPDAVVCATYKFLLGPYGSTLSYYGPRFDGGQPIEHSWMARKGSEDFASLSQYTEHIQVGAARYSVGESANFIALPMLADALHQIITWGPAQIQAYCSDIKSALWDAIGDNHYLAPSESSAAHLFGIYPLHQNVGKLVKQLAQKDIYVSARGNAIRVAPYVFNRAEDLQRLASELRDGYV